MNFVFDILPFKTKAFCCIKHHRSTERSRRSFGLIKLHSLVRYVQRREKFNYPQATCFTLSFASRTTEFSAQRESKVSQNRGLLSRIFTKILSVAHSNEFAVKWSLTIPP